MDLSHWSFAVCSCFGSHVRVMDDSRAGNTYARAFSLVDSMRLLANGLPFVNTEGEWVLLDGKFKPSV